MPRKLTGSSGQTLGLVALVMVVMLIFLALAIDVGLIYQQRRAMQNAADGGALAAARAYCFGGPNGGYGTVDQAIFAGEDYAITRNVADEATVTPSEGNFVWTVRATKEVNLVFADIVGLPTMTVGAVAAAKCGQATSACGLWPIAFSDEQWEDIYDGGNGCGEPIAIYTDKLEKCDPLDPDPKWCCDCEDPDDPSCDDPDCYEIDCDTYDCDLSNPKDGNDDVFTDKGRAWIDFSGYEDPDNPGGDCPSTGCGADELGHCIAGSPNVLLGVGDCMSADLGVRGGIKGDVDSRKGDVVGLPLYDPYTACEGPESCRSNAYLVTGFGCIEIDKNNPWHRLQLKPKEGTGKPWNGWVILATMYCDGCSTNCGGTSGSSPNPGDADLRAVSLIQ